jgi:hypothetical protein
MKKLRGGRENLGEIEYLNEFCVKTYGIGFKFKE